MRWDRRTAEEVANAVTHGVGLVASLVALPFLVGAAPQPGDALLTTGRALFAGSLVLLYAASTLYHAVPPSALKQRLRILDHAAIYLVIAGSYTPFALGVLRGRWGFGILAAIWTLALAGIVWKLFGGLRFERTSTVLYLAMGWLALVVAGPLVARMPMAGLAWIAAGGLAYTIGVLFYRWERLPFGHTVWHLFVLAGSACHGVAVHWYASGG